MGKQDIFRKVSIERMSSPEQLDVLMKVTSPMGWVSLVSIGVLLGVALLWGLYGTITTTVAGKGILIRSGGVRSVESPAPGQLIRIYVDVDDTVTKGQLLARIAQPNLLSALNADKAHLQELNREYDQIVHFSTENLKAKLESYSIHQADCQSAIKTDQEQMGWLNERLDDQKKLLDDGLIRKQDYLSTKKQIFDIHQAIQKSRRDINQLAIDEMEFKHKQQEHLVTKKQQIDKLKAQVDGEIADFKLKSRIVSPYTGTILEIAAAEGSGVTTGEKILTMELTGAQVDDLEAILYVPAADGKKVKPGMKIDISPSTVNKEDFGCMLGIVTSVSAFPTTPKRMLHNLQNQKLVDTFSAQGAPIEVRAHLIANRCTTSGYRWTSSSGPPITIGPGTVCTGAITDAKRAPIELLVPLLKRKVLGIGMSEK